MPDLTAVDPRYVEFIRHPDAKLTIVVGIEDETQSGCSSSQRGATSAPRISPDCSQRLIDTIGRTVVALNPQPSSRFGTRKDVEREISDLAGDQALAHARERCLFAGTSSDGETQIRTADTSILSRGAADDAPNSVLRCAT